MDWQLAVLAVLAVADAQHALVQVDVGAVEPAGLRGAQAGDRQ
jgi:hypothetical protein